MTNLLAVLAAVGLVVGGIVATAHLCLALVYLLDHFSDR